MKKKLLALLMGTTFALAACAGGEDVTEPAEKDEETPPTEQGDNKEAEAPTETAAGEEIYQSSTCLSCHGQNLEGGAGPDLTQVGSRLTKDEIETVILEGRGAMQGGFLTGEDATAVATWLAEKK